ncbi:Signal transduction histidine kinase CheA [hydrothermal vent metagenome]|uniref:Chemotaxis protein CheA n=1 Tax=hydrothermal vent metagenome TaxID=652676 RepID=A0A3B0UTI3_9ZZZZ
MSELDEFKATYFEECTELLAALEEEFVAIEEGDREPDRLNAVFRAIHSIKGGAGAFGFSQLVEFAHSFETLLDYVRDGRVEMNAEVVALCIRSNDLVADFVAAARQEETLVEGFGAKELARFKSLCAGEGGADEESMEDFDIDFTPVMVNLGDEEENDASAPPAEEAGRQDGQEEADSFDYPPMQSANGDWKIVFTPHYQLYERANDPLLLLRELSTLGEIDVRARLLKVPALNDFDPFGVYCAWDITLSSEKVTKDAIVEVFEFVEGDCDIEITRQDADQNMADQPLQPVKDLAEEIVDASKVDAGAKADIAAKEEESAPSFAELAAEIVPVVKKAEPEKALKPANDGAAKVAKKANGAKSPAIQSIRVDLDKVDRVVNMVGELVITQSMLTQQMDDRLKAQYQELVRGVEVLAQTTRGLQDAVMAIRAQPVKSVFSRMPRLVRELSTKTGKKIRLEMVGEHTEIDKTIIEQLSDPLTHMIRNSADHGVEMPETRQKAGKPEVGTIRLSAEQAGGNIIIAVEDDGAGINRPRVLELARERGVVGPDQQLSDEQIDELVFAPGFSTADAVSDISGRGVGMDVVVSNIKKIGGSVHVRSSPGQGTRMLLRLPLTLAVLDVMLVEVGGAPYVIPLGSIVETMQCDRADFGRVPSGRRVLQVRGEYVHVTDLAASFAMKTEIADAGRFVVLCEAEGSTKIAIIVDQIIGQQQVVIKSLEENFRRIDGIAGGTILGDGKVALIVDVQGLKSGSEQKTAA